LIDSEIDFFKGSSFIILFFIVCLLSYSFKTLDKFSLLLKKSKALLISLYISGLLPMVLLLSDALE